MWADFWIELFRLPTCLVLCQYHVGSVTMALLYDLGSSIVIIPDVFFQRGVASAIHDLLFSHTNFYDLSSSSVENITVEFYQAIKEDSAPAFLKLSFH